MTSPLDPTAVKIDAEAERDKMLEAFEDKTKSLKENSDYYDSNRRPQAIGIAVPPKMRDLLANIGYPRLYVDAIVARLKLSGFRLSGADAADEEMWQWWEANGLDVESTLGHADALIHGRAYITISAPNPETDFGVDLEVPIIRVEPPTNLYAEIDPRTRQVKQAIRAVYSDDGSKVVMATLYTPMETHVWIDEDGEWTALKPIIHNLGVVPVVPILNRTRLSDITGTSEITPEIRSATDAAARIMMDMQGTAEIMAIPQRLLFGVKPQDIGVDPESGQKLFDAYMARILAFEDHEAKAQQFTAAELRNFTEAIDAIDRKVASYTGLPPQYLSVTSENPASAEAIRAVESRLVMHCERKATIFGNAWEQAMRIAYRVMKGGDVPAEYFRMEAVWRDPSTPTYAAKADAAAKLYANGLGVIPKKRARYDIGYSETEISQMEDWDEDEKSDLMKLYGEAGPPKPGAGPPSEDPPETPEGPEE